MIGVERGAVALPGGVRVGGHNKDAALPAFSMRKKMLDLIGNNLLAYWKFIEPTGTSAVDASGHGCTATYSGVTLANGVYPANIGGKGPLFSGSGGYIDLYSPALSGSFNGQVGFYNLIGKFFDANVWVDSTSRMLMQIRANTSDILYLSRTPVNNELSLFYGGGGVNKNIKSSALGGTTDWFMATLTWDLGAGATGEVKAYLNGTQVSTTQTNMGTWTGTALNANLTLVGGANKAGGLPMKGWLGHLSLGNRALTPTEIATMYSWVST